MTEQVPQTAPPPTARAPRTAAFFDLDKTIIATSSSAAFSKPFLAGGLLSRADVLRSAYAHFVFLIGNADADQTERMRAHLSSLVTGWDVEKVRQIVTETVHELIDPYVYAEAVELIAEHHAAGRDVVVVSASAAVLVEPIAAVLGADHVLSTQMTVEDGRFTGEIDFYNYGENKAGGLRRLAAREGYDLAQSFAYSDSITDAPMLEAVGHGYVVNPDRLLRRRAAQSGWGVLAFTRPVALRPRIEPAPLIAVVGAVAVGLGVWLVWRAVRRRARRR
ncbi:HAD family hydrolase [Promicromonospora thailandica]|uniref:HAD-superfamily subfamily IB hydrolase, TIGR01490 n=1 Tax=Promicromonospora thailandica TaxID=765201 RepID=A0A9X2G6I8_9MICO|nr:HAD-IB family hydrolase [Promicromonospora thailandica]MCP2263486.1 HAD-superfamily subfamily IB hydrolase, TIGR01490 [Promicromonospora thailandica]